jgi:hypothetical protein
VGNYFHRSLCHFPFCCLLQFPFIRWEFDSLQLSNPQHWRPPWVYARENTHEMPPRKRPRKEFPTEDSSQAIGVQVLKTITQPQISIEPHAATEETRRPEEPPRQPTTQAEVPAMNISAPNTERSTQHQETKAQEDQQQDSKEEIKAVIEDELACLHHENECL